MKMFNVCAIAVMFCLVGCGPPSSDQVQREQSEVLLKEGTASVGMPSIKNFRERKLAKDILEMRDQEGLLTYTYLENLIPTVVPGHTALGGKYTYLGQTIGFGLPYAVRFTNPEKLEHLAGRALVTIPQADPNGLFSPESASATWILMVDPATEKAVPQYIESAISVFTFKLPLD